MVPKEVVHRTRAPEQTSILMIEEAGVVPTGDADEAGRQVLGRHASEDDVEPQMKERVVEYWSDAAPELGERVAEDLGVETTATANK